MKIWKREKKSEQSQQSTENVTVIDENMPGSAVQNHTDVAEGSEVPETFKEHYPLLLPFSYAAIVEDEKNEVKYSLLEPTLTELDEEGVRRSSKTFFGMSFRLIQKVLRMKQKQKNS